MQTKHVAWISVGQFHPAMHVGGLYDLLSRLRYLRDCGHRVSILDFVAGDVDHQGFDQALAARSGVAIRREGDLCRALLQGIPYVHQVLPVAQERLMERPQPIVPVVMDGLRREGVDYVLTVDEAYWALLASFRLGLPGAHLFNLVLEIKRFARNPGYVWLLKRRTVIAYSHFLRGEIAKRLGLDAVVWNPFVHLDDYRCERDGRRTGRIGFYSDGKRKGSEIVAEIIARMPEREFLVIGYYEGRPADAPPPNLTRWGHIPDMRDFYREIDLLLVPSICKEPYGRVVLEAAVNGIPVIANRDGGIPEALGGSGVLIDREPDLAAMAAKYVREIRRLLDDRATYDCYARQAVARAEVYECEQLEASHAFRQRYLC